MNPTPTLPGYRESYESAAIFDRSAVAKLEISGPDAPKFLTNLCTNELQQLPLGGGCEAYFLDHRAKTLFQTSAYHVMLSGNRHAIWLETVPGYGAKLLKHLDKYLISEAVELRDVTETFGQMHLAGPHAKAVIEAAIGEPIPNLGEFMHMDRTFGAGSVCNIRRRDLLGVCGYDIVCLKEKFRGVWQMLVAAGATIGDDATYETRRVEAGTPVYGTDIDESRFVMEIANVQRAICYTKGCFIGQEPIIMSRDRAGFVSRAFLGMKILEGGTLPSGTKLFRDGQEIGLVTSSVFSPKHDAPIAIGYIRRPHHDAGLKFEADAPDGKRAVELIGAMPQ